MNRRARTRQRGRKKMFKKFPFMKKKEQRYSTGKRARIRATEKIG